MKLWKFVVERKLLLGMMTRSSSGSRINIETSTKKLEVDNRISLRFYYRIADNILKQVLSIHTINVCVYVIYVHEEDFVRIYMDDMFLLFINVSFFLFIFF